MSLKKFVCVGGWVGGRRGGFVSVSGCYNAAPVIAFWRGV